MNVLVHELVDVDFAVVVLVALVEEFIDDFLAMLLVDALLSEEDVHFCLVDLAVSIQIYSAKLHS